MIKAPVSVTGNHSFPTAQPNVATLTRDFQSNIKAQASALKEVSMNYSEVIALWQLSIFLKPTHFLIWCWSSTVCSCGILAACSLSVFFTALLPSNNPPQASCISITIPTGTERNNITELNPSTSWQC